MIRPILATLLALMMFTTHAEVLADNPRLAEIFNADQAARTVKPIDWTRVAAQDKAHQDEVTQLLHAGAVRTANDHYRAAMVMQHGSTTESFQLAFGLAQLAMAMDPGHKRARWLAAASWDRILMSKNVPQWYGTQYRSNTPGGPMELYRVDEAVVTDAERAAMNVPSLQEAKDRVQRMHR